MTSLKMKLLVIISIAIVLAASACEKQEVYIYLHGRCRITGISGSIACSQQVRNFDVLFFKQSGFYSVLLNGSAIKEGTYDLEKKKPDNTADNAWEFRIRFTESYNKDPYCNFYTDYPMIITFDKDNTLTLSQADISDGFNYHFVRD